MSFESYKNLDFGTKPSTAKCDDVVVTIDGLMVQPYAKAYIKEANRVNPLKSQSLDLTLEELQYYLMAILAIRVESISTQGCKNWRVAKQLIIPDFFQYVISCVGIVTDHTYGLRFIPTFTFEYDISKLLETSSKLDSLRSDGLTASKDAFPRSEEGDPDVMNFIIAGDYVYGRTEQQSPTASYVAAFLGLKLREENVFKMLYRVRYDDVEFIEQSLMNERSIICST